ncbi:hypothetical protein D3C75_1122210 [compost metagenome]
MTCIVRVLRVSMNMADFLVGQPIPDLTPCIKRAVKGSVFSPFCFHLCLVLDIYILDCFTGAYPF